MTLTRSTLASSLPTLAILALLALLQPTTASAGQPVHNATVGLNPRIRAIATAYGSGPACNAQWSGRTAIGTRLRSGAVTSAAADWSKFPLGTRFRVVETGRIYEVDDYGSAMVGKMKVDLYTASGALSKWGVRHVTLEILSWGSRERSLALLTSRKASRYAHIRKMVASLRDQLAVTEPKKS